jgi:hypothetical protein
MFTLTNPSAITFPRFNADNTVSPLTAANFRSAIGAGTVTTLTAAAGTPISITNNTTTPELSMNAASASVPGYLLSADWTTFNNKQAALGFTPANSTITVATTAPLQGGGNLTANRTLSITQASGSVNGFLSSTDWTTFNNKQPQLNGSGFVKASGTNITYDNSSYLRTGLADSTYLKLTGGTLTGNLRLSSSNATQLNIDANDNNLESRITFSTIGSARSKIYTTSSVSSMTFESIAQASARRGFRFISSTEATQYLGLVQDPQGNVGIKSDASGNDVHPNTLYVNGTLGITGAATLSSTLAVTGDITEAGNNVMTNLDTVSLSNRINGKVGLTGNETISGDKTFTNKIILNDSSRFESNVLFKKNFGLPIVKISNTNYTATTANHTIIYTTLTSDKTLTIPNASDAVGIKYTISIFDTPEGNEALTIVTPSNNSFVITDGEGASVDIVGGYCTILQSDGIKWYVLSYSPMY